MLKNLISWKIEDKHKANTTAIMATIPQKP